LPGITFDGVANQLTNLTTTDIQKLPVTTVPGEIWSLANNTSVVVGYKSIMRYGSFGTLDRLLYTNNNARQDVTVGDGTTTLIASTSPPLTGSVIVAGTWGSSLISGRLNGAVLVPASVSWGTSTNSTRLAIGSHNGGAPGHFWGGVLRHVIVVGGRPLTTQERQLLEGYLAWDGWSTSAANPLPSNHPYKGGPP